MRPYSPGGILNALAAPLEVSIPQTAGIHRLWHGLPGYLIPFAPHAFAPQRQNGPSGPPSPPVFLRYLRISPLHLEFHPPLTISSLAVLRAVPELSPGISPLTCYAAYVPFTPSKSEQRLHPPYYRGCWHGVSRCLFLGYRHYLPLEKSFTTQRPSSLTRYCCVRLSPIAQNSHCCLP